MNYYKIDGLPIQSEIELNSGNGYPQCEDEGNQLTAEQYNELLNPAPIEPNVFEIAKANKQNEFNMFAYNFVASGYFDSITNYTLFTSKDDISNYAILLNALQFENDNTQIEFGTTSGWTSNTCIVVKGLLERYSQYCRPITTKILRLQTQIENAQSLTDLENIII